VELEFLQWLRNRLPLDMRAPLGLSDDAAILQLSGGGRVVATVDMLTEGVDFLLAQDRPQRIGRKALAVNLSDLAAMAARPFAALVALTLPRKGGMELAKQLFEGIIPLAEEFGVALAGGDTNTWDGPLVISVTLLGDVTEHGPLLRSGAKAGDAIVVTGKLGGSRLGHQFDFRPRVREALWLAENSELHAGLDLSDGLALDLWRMCQASNLGAIVEIARVPVSEDAAKWAANVVDGSTPVEHALSDGEDFELLLAMPPRDAERLVNEQPLACGLTIVGEFVSASGAEDGRIWRREADGSRAPLVPRGYEH
jgi:thiamine-monophosphate kinase